MSLSGHCHQWRRAMDSLRVGLSNAAKHLSRQVPGKLQRGQCDVQQLCIAPSSLSGLTPFASSRLTLSASERGAQEDCSVGDQRPHDMRRAARPKRYLIERSD